MCSVSAEVKNDTSEKSLYMLHSIHFLCGWAPHFAGQIFLQCSGEAGVLVASAKTLKQFKPDLAPNAAIGVIANMANSAKWEDPAQEMKQFADAGLHLAPTKLQTGNLLVVPPGHALCMVPLNDSTVAGAAAKFFNKAPATQENLKIILDGMAAGAHRDTLTAIVQGINDQGA